MKTQRRFILMTAMLLSLLILGITALAEGNSGGSIPGAPLAAAPTPTPRTVKLTITVLGPDRKPAVDTQVDITHDAYGPEFRAYDYRLKTDGNGIASTKIIIGEKWNEGSSWYQYWPVVDIEVIKDGARGSGRVKFAPTYYQNRETGEWGREKERDGVKFLGPDYRSKESIEIVMHAVDSRGFSLISVKVHVEHENGDAADGAKVVISGSGVSERYQGITDANGDTTIPVANTFAGKERFGIEASKNRYTSTKTFLELNDKQIGEVVAAPTIKIKKVPGVVVTVNVKDKDSTFGVGEARVVLDGAGSQYYFDTQTTDSSGTASFFVPERGKIKLAVKISRNSYEPLNDGEVRLSEDDESKTVEFFLKAKPKKTEGRNSIEVKVLQGDKIERFTGNLPLPDAVVTVAGIIRSTDRSGQVKIEGFFEGNVEVVVEAKGYKRQTRTVQMSKEERFTGGTASVEFIMQPESSEGSIEVSVVTSGKNDEGPIPLAGVTVTAGGETTTTNADGRAKLTGDFAESVEVAVEKSGYLRQAKNVNASGGKGSATFTLQNEPVEDVVSITVMALDPKGGSSTPVAGAQVSAKGVTATTDQGGKATITGDFKDGVEVEAKAKDFVSQVQQVSIAKPERTGSANFLLQPKTSLSLIIEVRDSAAPNNPLEEALVILRPLGKTTGSTRLAEQRTNAQGEASLELRGSAEQISQFRSGLTLHVGKAKYKAKLSDIAADRLTSSSETLRWTVFLERDWTELANALGKLEAEAASLSNDARETGVKSQSVNNLAAKSLAARGRAESWKRELDNAWMAFSGARVKSLTRCQEAVTIKEGIRSLQTEAVGKERQLKTLLNEATALAAACSSQADADSISSKHKNAIRLIGEIGALGPKAMDANQKLSRYAEAMKDAGALQLQVQQVLGNIDNELTAAKKDASTADADFDRALVLYKGLLGRRGQIQTELDRLKIDHEVAKDYLSIPKELIRRLEALSRQLDINDTVNFGTSPDETRRDVVREAVTAIQGYKTSADAIGSQLSLDIKCDVQPMDDVVEDIRTVVRNSGFELGLAADLPNKAAECAKRGACLPLVEEVRALIKSGALQSAEAKLNQARGQGCDLSALPGGASLAEELDYYKTLNEAVALLKTAQGNCKFQDALDWAGRLPESIRSTPSIANTLSEVRAGLAAQQRIQQLRNAARDAVASANTMVAADPFIRQAEQIAAPVPCLVEEVSRFRAEFPVNTDKKPVDKIEVEEIPDDTTGKDPAKIGKTEGGGFWDSTKEKAGAGHKPPPVVEEIPDDDNRTTAGNKPPGKGTKTVEVEEIPDDDKAGTKKVGVEEIPDDDNAGASTKTGGSSNQTAGNRSSDKPKKEKKPKDPNKPGFWDRLGTAVGQTIRDNIDGGTGNTGGTTGGGTSNPGGTTDSGGEIIDMAGTWIVTESDHVWRLVLSPSGSNEWRGVPVFIRYSSGGGVLWEPGNTGDEITVQATGRGRFRALIPVWDNKQWVDGTYDATRFAAPGYVGVRAQ